MSNASIRVGWSSRDAGRPPGLGSHLGLFRVAHIGADRAWTVAVGRLTLERRDLEPLREKGLRLKVTVVGVLRLSDDVSPALASAVLDARVIGWVAADARTRAALVSR